MPKKETLISTIEYNGFMSGYVVYMFDDLSGYSLWDLTNKSLLQIVSDCREFLAYPGVQEILMGGIRQRSDYAAGIAFWASRSPLWISWPFRNRTYPWSLDEGKFLEEIADKFPSISLKETPKGLLEFVE